MPGSFPKPWHQGEHVFVAGDTGTGKTYLIVRLLRLRTWCVFVKTKADKTSDKIAGFRRVKLASKVLARLGKRWVLDPGAEMFDQWHQIALLMDRLFSEGSWTLVIDEGYYVQDLLKLGQRVIKWLTQGRSLGLSIVIGAQRLAWVTKFAPAEATHIFILRSYDSDYDYLRRSFGRDVADAVMTLQGHDFVYFHRPSRDWTTGNANELDAVVTRG